MASQSLSTAAEPLVASTRGGSAQPNHWKTKGITVTVERDQLSSSHHAVTQNHPNGIHTTKYTAVNWLPKALWRQFQKAANVFFLFVALSLVLGGCPPRGAGMAVTFAITVIANIIWDMLEDVARGRDDKTANTQVFQCYDPIAGSFAEKSWEDCQQGDVMLIHVDQAIPADVLIVASSDENGSCFVSSASLDGETSLKRCMVDPAINAMVKPNVAPLDVAWSVNQTGLFLAMKTPCRNLLSMEGRASVEGKSHQVFLDNFFLRGMVLRNTQWAICIACFVGDDTKIQLNAAATPSKFSDLHFTLNRVLSCFLLYLLSLCLFVAIGSATSGAAIRPKGTGVLCNTDYFVVIVWRSVLTFYPLVPVTLYLMTQLTKEFSKKQLNQDCLMQADDDGPHACMRTSDLVEELGQVSVVFSDKTGTLTVNEMCFAGGCIGDRTLDCFTTMPGDDFSRGARAAKQLLESGNDLQARRFFELLALCHDVQVDANGCFQGESPDEVALVDAAKSVGVVLQSRKPLPQGAQLTLRGPGGEESVHTISHVLAFTSDRKRMSVVCAKEDGSALVLTKGADLVMEQIMTANLPPKAEEANRKFARGGYRTLVVASREMEADAYAEWSHTLALAQENTDKREEAVYNAMAIVERDLEYIGLTVIEDRLQDAVPETISTIRTAGIGFWMLTGDKIETAVAIAKFSALITDQMSITRITGSMDPAEAAKMMEKALQSKCGQGREHALILDGASMLAIWQDVTAQRALYELGIWSKACVCCRLSPMQKRELVELVRKYNPDRISLAIGDGANDVPMLQGARVGVGIRGKEGTAAVQSCDVAISQFRFLRNLLFCHGRKAYRRLTAFLLWYTYKQVTLSWSNVLHAVENKFQASSCWPGNLEDPMNLLEFLTFIILFRDADIPDSEAIQKSFAPSLHAPGLGRSLFNAMLVGKWMLYATWHGIVAWLVPTRLLTSDAGWTVKFDTDGTALPRPREFWAASITVYTVITIITYLKLAISMRKNLSLIGWSTVLVIFLCYPLILALLIWNVPVNPFYTPELADDYTAFIMFRSMPHLMCILITPCIALLPDFVEVLVQQICEDSSADSRTLQGQEGPAGGPAAASAPPQSGPTGSTPPQNPPQNPQERQLPPKRRSQVPSMPSLAEDSEDGVQMMPMSVLSEE